MDTGHIARIEQDENGHHLFCECEAWLGPFPTEHAADAAYTEHMMEA